MKKTDMAKMVTGIQNKRNSEVLGIPGVEMLHAPTKDSRKEILDFFNKPRRYRPSDFKKQHFIPDL